MKPWVPSSENAAPGSKRSNIFRTAVKSPSVRWEDIPNLGQRNTDGIDHHPRFQIISGQLFWILCISVMFSYIILHNYIIIYMYIIIWNISVHADDFHMSVVCSFSGVPKRRSERVFFFAEWPWGNCVFSRETVTFPPASPQRSLAIWRRDQGLFKNGENELEKYGICMKLYEYVT